MGLAEPRKRIKISHDPRNTTWTNSSDSYGQRLMQRQGWKAGEALGARGRGSKFSDAEAARVNVRYKDDMLGLGATLKSKDVASRRTGFDAFQGLLGRLNAKTEEELQVFEKKQEERKLASFAHGRWGSMLFVPGGLLVQSDPYKQVEALKKAKVEDMAVVVPGQTTDQVSVVASVQVDEKAKRRAEKKQRKEERRLKREAKNLRKELRLRNKEGKQSLPTPDADISGEDETPTQDDTSTPKTTKRQRSPKAVEEKSKPESKTVVATQPQLRNGRHLLRGKNIQAKRMAFSDMKGLDEIFMKVR